MQLRPCIAAISVIRRLCASAKLQFLQSPSICQFVGNRSAAELSPLKRNTSHSISFSILIHVKSSLAASAPFQSHTNSLQRYQMLRGGFGCNTAPVKKAEINAYVFVKAVATAI